MFSAFFRALMHNGDRIAILAAYFFLTWGLLYMNGQYTGPGFFLAVVGFFSMLAAIAHTTTPSEYGRGNEGIAWILLLALALEFWIDLRIPHVLYVTASFQVWVHNVLVGLACVLLPIYAAHRRIPSVLRSIIFAGAIVTFAILSLQVMHASSTPRIDVFVMSQESAEHLLHGRNPYTIPISNVYQGRSDMLLPGYTYTPATLYLQTIGYLLAGDVRLMNAIAILGFALGIWWLLRRTYPVAAELLALLWLLFPRNLFVLEQAWIDPFLLCGILAFMLWFERRNTAIAGGILGFALSIKHYSVFLLPSLLLLRPSRKLLIIMAAVACAVFVPFLLWSPKDLLDNGILYQLQSPLRADSLSLSSLLYAQWDIAPPGRWINGAIALGVGLGLARALRNVEPLYGFALAMTVSFYAAFLLGNQAFLNYYYLVCGLMLASIALSIRALQPQTNEE